MVSIMPLNCVWDMDRIDLYSSKEIGNLRVMGMDDPTACRQNLA